MRGLWSFNWARMCSKQFQGYWRFTDAAAVSVPVSPQLAEDTRICCCRKSNVHRRSQLRLLATNVPPCGRCPGRIGIAHSLRVNCHYFLLLLLLLRLEVLL